MDSFENSNDWVITPAMATSAGMEAVAVKAQSPEDPPHTFVLYPTLESPNTIVDVTLSTLRADNTTAPESVPLSRLPEDVRKNVIEMYVECSREYGFNFSPKAMEKLEAAIGQINKEDETIKDQNESPLSARDERTVSQAKNELENTPAEDIVQKILQTKPIGVAKRESAKEDELAAEDRRTKLMEAFDSKGEEAASDLQEAMEERIARRDKTFTQAVTRLRNEQANKGDEGPAR